MMADLVTQHMEHYLKRPTKNIKHLGGTKQDEDAKEDVDIRRMLVFGGSGLVTGVWTDMWFGMLTHFISPTSIINIAAVTLIDNFQNVVLIAIMQAYSAWAMNSSVWNTLKEDFTPMAWFTLAIHIPTDLLVFLVLKTSSSQAATSLVVDSLSTILLSYFTFRNINQAAALAAKEAGIDYVSHTPQEMPEQDTRNPKHAPVEYDLREVESSPSDSDDRSA